MIELSVVVCTYNRAAMLSGALESLAQQTLDKTLYETIVVDNASTDNTRQVVEEFQQRHPECCLRLIHEPQQGLGYARNAGFGQAKGCYVAFMDDDARATQNWLRRALDIFEAVQPAPCAIGGRILPFYWSPKPKWFKDRYEIRTLGDKARVLHSGESFSGSNMIIRKSVLERHGGFATDLGVSGERLSVGEETALFERMWQSANGTICHYSPELIVSHAVPAHKMTVSYRLRRCFASGQASTRLNPPDSRRKRLKLVLRSVALVARAGLRALAGLRRYPGLRPWMFERVGPVAMATGQLLGYLGLCVAVRQREA